MVVLDPQTPRRVTLIAGEGVHMSDERPSTREAADIVENDEALQAAGDSADEDAATDDDARTADTSPVGDTRTD